MSIPFDKVSFLFLCIRHAGGKIDFAAVAKDYETIHQSPLSRNAAAKRYQRLKEKLDKADITPGGKRVRVEEFGECSVNGRVEKKVKKEMSDGKNHVKMESDVKLHVKVESKEENL